MRRAAVLWTVLVVGLGCASSAWARPALFRAGVGSVTVNPSMPVYPGGVGLGGGSAITKRHGDFTARAIYISNGRNAVVLASTDSFGQFAAYDGQPDLGLAAIRARAAAEIDQAGIGPHINAADIMIQSTHSHGAASVIGLWGPPPVPYMEQLAAGEVKAIVESARRAQPAYLQYGAVSAPYLNSLTLTTQDSYRGFQADGQLSILRAVSPATMATIGAYVNVPVHPIINLGLNLGVISSDFDGPARRDIENAIGGKVVMGPGTLGRQDPPWMQGDRSRLNAAYATADWFAGEVANLATTALENAQWISDDRIASAQTTLQVLMTNPAVLTLIFFHHFGEAQQIGNSVDIAPLDRSQSAPWMSGNVLGTPLTALRIGGLLYLSQPGEAFPAIRLNLARLISGPTAVVTLDQAQDMLGYYFPPWEGTMGDAYSPQNDHTLFNISPDFAGSVVDTDLALARTVGFRSLQAGVLNTFPLPADNYVALGQGGVQALASPSNGDACPFTTQLRAIYTAAGQTDDLTGQHDPRGELPSGTVNWNFGDGRMATSGYYTYHSLDATPVGNAMFNASFPVGTHSVTVTATEQTGGMVTFTIPVTVHPALVAHVTARRLSNGAWRVAISATGGDGALVNRVATFSDGVVTQGPAVTHRFSGKRTARSVEVTITDATGTSASVEVPLAGSVVHRSSTGCSGPRF